MVMFRLATVVAFCLVCLTCSSVGSVRITNPSAVDVEERHMQARARASDLEALARSAKDVPACKETHAEASRRAQDWERRERELINLRITAIAFQEDQGKVNARLYDLYGESLAFIDWAEQAYRACMDTTPTDDDPRAVQPETQSQREPVLPAGVVPEEETR